MCFYVLMQSLMVFISDLDRFHHAVMMALSHRHRMIFFRKTLYDIHLKKECPLTVTFIVQGNYFFDLFMFICFTLVCLVQGLQQKNWKKNFQALIISKLLCPGSDSNRIRDSVNEEHDGRNSLVVITD